MLKAMAWRMGVPDIMCPSILERECLKHVLLVFCCKGAYSPYGRGNLHLAICQILLFIPGAHMGNHFV